MEHPLRIERVPGLAVSSGDRAAYTFMDYSAELDGRPCTLTWAQVDQHARDLADSLARRLAPGQRVGILAPQGLEYVIALLGACYARVVAVPLFPPDLPGHAERLR